MQRRYLLELLPCGDGNTLFYDVVPPCFSPDPKKNVQYFSFESCVVIAFRPRPKCKVTAGVACILDGGI